MSPVTGSLITVQKDSLKFCVCGDGTCGCGHHSGWSGWSPSLGNYRYPCFWAFVFVFLFLGCSESSDFLVSCLTLYTWLPANGRKKAGLKSHWCEPWISHPSFRRVAPHSTMTYIPQPQGISTLLFLGNKPLVFYFDLIGAVPQLCERGERIWEWMSHKQLPTSLQLVFHLRSFFQR